MAQSLAVFTSVVLASHVTTSLKTCPGFPGYCSESFPGQTCNVVCDFGRNNVPLCQDDGTWTDIPRCIEHEPGVDEQIPGICPGIPGYCAQGFLNQRCTFDCVTGPDINSVCSHDGTWEPYPVCDGDLRETRDGCDGCPGPLGGPRNRTAERGGFNQIPSSPASKPSSLDPNRKVPTFAGATSFGRAPAQQAGQAQQPAPFRQQPSTPRQPAQPQRQPQRFQPQQPQQFQQPQQVQPQPFQQPQQVQPQQFQQSQQVQPQPFQQSQQVQPQQFQQPQQVQPQQFQQPQQVQPQPFQQPQQVQPQQFQQPQQVQPQSFQQPQQPQQIQSQLQSLGQPGGLFNQIRDRINQGKSRGQTQQQLVQPQQQLAQQQVQPQQIAPQQQPALPSRPRSSQGQSFGPFEAVNLNNAFQTAEAQRSVPVARPRIVDSGPREQQNGDFFGVFPSVNLQ